VGVRLGRAKGRQMPVIHEAAFLGVRVLRSARLVLSCVADVTLSRGGDQGRVVPPTLDSLRSYDSRDSLENRLESLFGNPRILCGAESLTVVYL
jgi:hypothetical protein